MRKFTILACILLSAAGCGAPAPNGTGAFGRVAGQNASAQKPDPLGLTADQKTKLQAVMKAHADAAKAKEGDRTAAKQALATALTADTVDTGNLTSLLQAENDKQAAALDDQISLMSDIRAIYTPDQIAKLANGPKAGGMPFAGAAPRPGASRVGMISGFGHEKLTDAQKAALDKLKTDEVRDEATKLAARDAAGKAMQTFMQNGDAAALKAAITAAAPTPQTADEVAFIASLDLTQRTALAQQVMSAGPAGGKPGMGGPGKRPGMGGPGGRPGMGGPGAGGRGPGFGPGMPGGQGRPNGAPAPAASPSSN